MADSFQIHSQGSGIPLVFIHGWGLNSAIFSPLVTKLSNDFEVITIDLPGFGANTDMTLDDYSLIEISHIIAQSIPHNSVLIGWSLGGLVASQIALQHPEKSAGLVTITSTPHFIEQANWPGIKAQLLKSFHQQLALDSQKTINGFLKIQAMGSEHVRQDIKQIKGLIECYPTPSVEVLDNSLSLLETVDLRSKISALTLPIFRLYGRLDSLVPKKVITEVDKLLPNSQSHTFLRASHAPFISHPDEFYTVLIEWISGNISSN